MVTFCLKQKNKLRFTAEAYAMNIKSKIVLSLSLLVAPLALLAKSPESSYVESYHGRSGIPVPISVVMPEVPAEYAGDRVMLEFVVSATGQPMAVTSTTPSANPELVAALITAVSQWQFAPVLVDGLPVASKVSLPMVISDYFGNASRFAAN